MIKYRTVDITTDSAGAGTSSSQPMGGVLQAIAYIKPGSGSFSNGGTVTVTDTFTGGTLWREVAVNASAVRYPALTGHDSGGTALSTTYLQAPVSDGVTVTVSGCGASKAGSFRIIYAVAGS